MKTSQCKKGNPRRTSQTKLREARLKKEEKRRKEADLPPLLPPEIKCRWCGSWSPQVMACSRSKVKSKVLIPLCCRAA